MISKSKDWIGFPGAAVRRCDSDGGDTGGGSRSSVHLPEVELNECNTWARLINGSIIGSSTRLNYSINQDRFIMISHEGLVLVGARFPSHFLFLLALGAPTSSIFACWPLHFYFIRLFCLWQTQRELGVVCRSE